jgi:3-dehydroquinate synthase
MKPSLEVPVSEGSPYPVYCGTAIEQFLPTVWDRDWRQAVIIGDSKTSALLGASVARSLGRLADSVLTLSFSAGEQNKTRQTKEALEDAMLQAGVERGCCVVAVGGGVALDLAGFVAATYLRGVAHIHIATSLLGQVDAAIGGKTGVNTPCGKNLIGAFHNPRAVLLATQCLSTLPEVELRYGMAECVKHAVVGSPPLLDAIESCPPDPPSDSIVLQSARVKVAVVARDEREQGLRRVLNFGHTVGHAIEAATGYLVPHGQAVAWGMLVEATLARERFGMPETDLERIRAVIGRLGLRRPAPCPFDRLSDHWLKDKKTQQGQVHCSLPCRIGVMADQANGWRTPVRMQMLRRAWEDVFK